MSHEKLLSIVVPTRNRAACLSSLLDTLERYHGQPGADFQVIVADNSDNDALRRRVEESPLDIDYVYTPGVVSVVDNFNLTVPLIRGRFTCFLGDDDLVSSRLFELVALMDRENHDAAIVDSAVKSLYFWPGVLHKRWGEVGGRLYLSRCSGRIRLLDVRSALRRSRLRISDGPLDLPRAYFGVVATRCIAEVTRRYGNLFGGCSPDIFSSRLLAEVVSRCITVDLPFIVPGASKTSTSAARAERSDVGALHSNDHTGRFRELAWNPCVPEFYSPFTVWAQSLLQADALSGSRPRVGAFPYLYAKCILFSRGNFSRVATAVAANARPLGAALLTALGVVYVAGAYVVQKLPLLLRRAPGAAELCFENLADSDAATRKLDAQLAGVRLG